MHRVRRSTTPEVRLDLAPLIDVVFLLLTFFLFAMLLMVRADVLEIQLPAIAAGTPAAPGVPITVALTSEGLLKIDADPVEPEQLAERIRALREARNDPTLAVLLAVDERCESGVLIRVIDVLTGAGISEFAVLGTPAVEPDVSAPNVTGEAQSP